MAPPDLARLEFKLEDLLDQAHMAVDERNRALSLDITPSASSDRDLEKSLGALAVAIEELQSGDRKSGAEAKKRERLLSKYVAGYNDLLDHYKADASVDTSRLELKLETPQQKPKHVRFRDNLVDINNYNPALSSSSSSQKPTADSLNTSSAKDPASSDLRSQLFSAPYKDDPRETARAGSHRPYHDSDDDDDDDSDSTPSARRKNDLPGVDVNNHQHLSQQQLTLQEQDGHLDRLASSVSRQHTLSLHIGSELESHLELLDEMDHYADRSQSRLATAKQRLEKFSRKARDNGSVLTIAILFIIFIILLIVLK